MYVPFQLFMFVIKYYRSFLMPKVIAGLARKSYDNTLMSLV